MGVTAVGTWKYNHPVGFGVHQVRVHKNLGFLYKTCKYVILYVQSFHSHHKSSEDGLFRFLDNECRCLQRTVGWIKLPRFHCTGNAYGQHQGGGRFCFFLIFLNSFNKRRILFNFRPTELAVVLKVIKLKLRRTFFCQCENSNRGQNMWGHCLYFIS
jgi:hypothetical protein